MKLRAIEELGEDRGNLLADDPGRWERRDAIVSLLDTGLAEVKEDQKGRFNLLLRVANFERAVGRTAAARAGCR